METRRALAIGVAMGGALLGCVGGGGKSIPLCGPIESLPPLATFESCDERELGEYRSSLSEQIAGRQSRVLVRVGFDEASAIRSVCIERGTGYAPWSARSDLAEDLDAILAVPPGPACVAGKRLDLNRYNATWSQVQDTQARCNQEARTTLETEPGFGAPRVAGRDFDRCMRFEADWVLLDAPGSTRPVIFVKPETPNPSDARARDTTTRCIRTAWSYEERYRCIESEGWEALLPPPR